MAKPEFFPAPQVSEVMLDAIKQQGFMEGRALGLAEGARLAYSRVKRRMFNFQWTEDVLWLGKQLSAARARVKRLKGK